MFHGHTVKSLIISQIVQLNCSKLDIVGRVERDCDFVLVVHNEICLVEHKITVIIDLDIRRCCAPIDDFHAEVVKLNRLVRYESAEFVDFDVYTIDVVAFKGSGISAITVYGNLVVAVLGGCTGNILLLPWHHKGNIRTVGIFRCPLVGICIERYFLYARVRFSIVMFKAMSGFSCDGNGVFFICSNTAGG